MSDPALYDAYRDHFRSSLNLALQQRVSKLAPHVTMMESVTGLGAQVMKHLLPFETDVDTDDDWSDTKVADAEATSRWAYPKTLRKALKITQSDLTAMEDPSSQFMQTIRASIERAVDRRIIMPAFFGTVTGGLEQEKQYAFDTASHTVPVGEGGADSNINFAKITKAKQLFEEAEVDLDMEQPIMQITPKIHRGLLHMAEVKNSDFMKLGGVINENGIVTRFLGCMIRVSNIALYKQGSATVARIPIWVKSGMGLQPWLFSKERIGEREDKNYSLQLYHERRYGAARLEEGRVLEIECNEAAALV